jgi:hypothetical protein
MQAPFSDECHNQVSNNLSNMPPSSQQGTDAAAARAVTEHLAIRPTAAIGQQSFPM